MNEKNLTIGSTIILPKPELDALLADLRSDGYQTVGPRLQDESIVYKEIEGLKDLPRGLLSEQKPASYRLVQTDKERYFDFIPGGQSWKQFLFPPRQLLFTAQREGPEEHTEEHSAGRTGGASTLRHSLRSQRTARLTMPASFLARFIFFV